jgi:3-oxoacyl-[acyl-carrier protein] reductase
MGRAFEGRVAVITGSGQGIGHDLAIYMASEGCKVVTNNRTKGSSMQAHDGKIVKLNEVDEERMAKLVGDAESTASEIQETGGEAIAVYGNVAKPEDCRELIEAAIDKWGQIDIVINNAASHWTGNIKDMKIEYWDSCIESKLSGSFYLMHYALPHMLKAGYGRFVNVSSNAFIGLQGMAAYSAASCGIWAFTKAAALDLADFGITVNAITPLAATRSWYNALAEFREEGMPEEYIIEAAPDGMKVPPVYMAPAIAYLASEEFTKTGIMIKVEADGQLAVYSESEEYNNCGKDCLTGGAWTFPELQKTFTEELLKGVAATTSSLVITKSEYE